MIGLLVKWRRRLAWQWLWLSYVYPFYFAHKPLCERFRRDVLRIGHVHVCRSCTLVYAGIGSVAVLCWLFRAALQETAVELVLVLAGVTLALSFPAWYKYWPRPMRDVLRFALGGLIALCGFLLVSGHFVVGLAAAAGLLATWKAFMALRNRRSARRCDGCPRLSAERTRLSAKRICPGYALQASMIRRYEEAATELLAASMDLQGDVDAGSDCNGSASLGVDLPAGRHAVRAGRAGATQCRGDRAGRQ